MVSYNRALKHKDLQSGRRPAIAQCLELSPTSSSNLLSNKVLEGCYKVSLQPSLLQAEQRQLSQPVFTGEALQPSDHLHGPPLDSLQQPVLVLGIALTPLQDFALGLVELHEVHMGPPLKSVKAPLDGITSPQCVDRTTQLGVIGKLAEGALNLTVHVTSKDVKQHWSQYRPLRNVTRHWSLGFIPWYSTKQIHEEAKSALLKSRVPLLIGENKVQHSTSPHWLLYHLEKEVTLNAFQEPLGLLMPCCVVVVPPTNIKAVEVPHEDQGL
ncbi:hypothetical protein QYF61_003854 [Mycteria americana]|uniref:Uncharacterized protein n=1 Tax=Mycteria americana TaxID=33587 RepID=A0AAN7NDV6_MYCAM|nr:hypothetical protein QYF61_003854 [Mycteria americana]